MFRSCLRMAREREKELERRYRVRRGGYRKKPVVATAPGEGLASPNLTMDSLPHLGLSTSLSGPPQ